jgi:F-type H+-transporting ATPase subunit delta
VTSALARRYAHALLDVALDQGDAPALRLELGRAASLVAENAELQATLVHPGIAPDIKKKILAAVFAADSDVLRRLLGLLVDRGRIPMLPEVARAYTAALQAYKGVVPAEAVSATTLDAEDLKRLQGALKVLAGHEVEVVSRIDPALLGGVLVRMQGKSYDGSVRTRLRNLRGRLAGA